LAVATLAKACGSGEDETLPFHNMEEFLTHTYTLLIEQEGKKTRKKNRKIPLTFVEHKELVAGEDDVWCDMLVSKN
jgi:hypothetical protein